MTKRQGYTPLTRACHDLHLPYQRAWRAVVSGAVVAVFEGGRWRIPPDQLDALWSACSDSEAGHDVR